MAVSGRFDHRSPLGETAADRLRAAGVADWDVVAENLALSTTVRPPPPRDRGQKVRLCHDVDSLAADIESDWYASPRHRRDMTLPELTDVGTGAAYDPKTETMYVVQVYVRKLTKAPVTLGGPSTTFSGRPVRRQELRRRQAVWTKLAAILQRLQAKTNRMPVSPLQGPSGGSANCATNTIGVEHLGQGPAPSGPCPQLGEPPTRVRVSNSPA
jgi:hypothetical protein